MSVIDFTKAERKARKRDLEIENSKKPLTDEEMEEANRLQAKANSRNMLLIPERKIKNKARFVQFLQNNWDYLREKGYLTTEEKVFLVDIQAYIGLHSNALVVDLNQKAPVPLTQRELAKCLGTSETKISRVVNGLIKKGIMAKAESGVEGNNAKSYALFVNPNIIYAGDKDRVNETLQAMFQRPMTVNKVLKDLPDKLF